MDQIQNYVNHLKDRFSRSEVIVPPNVVSTLVRELETIAAGYEYIWQKNGDSLDRVNEQARYMAKEQGYDPNHIKIIPCVGFNYNHDGTVQSVVVHSSLWNVYALPPEREADMSVGLNHQEHIDHVINAIS